jgi:hypothetical protein
MRERRLPRSAGWLTREASTLLRPSPGSYRPACARSGPCAPHAAPADTGSKVIRSEASSSSLLMPATWPNSDKVGPRPGDAPVTTANGDAMRTAFLVEGNPLRSRNGREIDLPASEAHVDHAAHADAAGAAPSVLCGTSARRTVTTSCMVGGTAGS